MRYSVRLDTNIVRYSAQQEVLMWWKMLNKIIAANLKQLRSNKQWSLSQAATETTVSKAMLGQIEREESSPTIATLWKIAKGFSVSMSALIEEGNLIEALDSKQPSVIFEDIEFKVLFAFDPVLQCEMFVLYLKSGKTHISQPHATGIKEDIIVIEGQMEMLINDQWLKLNTGDVLRFEADKPHGYRNTSSQNTIFHNIIHYPKSAR